MAGLDNFKYDEDGCVWNFAYGSNMNRKVLVNRRKITYVRYAHSLLCNDTYSSVLLQPTWISTRQATWVEVFVWLYWYTLYPITHTQQYKTPPSPPSSLLSARHRCAYTAYILHTLRKQLDQPLTTQSHWAFIRGCSPWPPIWLLSWCTTQVCVNEWIVSIHASACEEENRLVFGLWTVVREIGQKTQK